MRCQRFPLPGGASAILCSRGKKPAPPPPRCGVCGKAEASRLCDGSGPAKGRKLCSLPLCDSCTRKDGPDRDLCPRHPVQGALL